MLWSQQQRAIAPTLNELIRASDAGLAQCDSLRCRCHDRIVARRPPRSVATLWQHSRRKIRPMRPRNPAERTIRTPADVAGPRLHISSGPCLGDQVEVRVLSSALRSVHGFVVPHRQAMRQPPGPRRCRRSAAGRSSSLRTHIDYPRRQRRGDRRKRPPGSPAAVDYV